MSDAFLIAATILGPSLAVQAQKAVERATEQRRQKLSVFHVLMATRAARVSPEHVQALNRIELQFSGWKVFGLIQWQTAAERAVIEAWRIPTRANRRKTRSRHGTNAAETFSLI
jgi:hypothetical protein